MGAMWGIAVVGMFGLNFQITLALIAKQTFHMGAGSYGALSGIAVVGVLAVLLVVFALRVKRLGQGSGRMIAIGVLIGLALVGIGLLSQRGA